MLIGRDAKRIDRGFMIFVRLFIDKIPDTWEPSTVLYLAAVETIIEVFLLSVVVYLARSIA
jgi:hypothetical protein